MKGQSAPPPFRRRDRIRSRPAGRQSEHTKCHQTQSEQAGGKKGRKLETHFNSSRSSPSARRPRSSRTHFHGHALHPPGRGRLPRPEPQRRTTSSPAAPPDSAGKPPWSTIAPAAQSLRHSLHNGIRKWAFSKGLIAIQRMAIPAMALTYLDSSDSTAGTPFRNVQIASTEPRRSTGEARVEFNPRRPSATPLFPLILARESRSRTPADPGARGWVRRPRSTPVLRCGRC